MNFKLALLGVATLLLTGPLTRAAYLPNNFWPNASFESGTNLDTPTGPRYFHMARAHKKAHNTQAAAQAFRKAKELGLKRAALHPVERLAFGAEFDELDEK